MAATLDNAAIWPLVIGKARGHGSTAAGAPVLTAYDQGARTELSAVTLANAVAKAANALVDEADIEPGDKVAVELPWHWQRCVWLLACWSAGATVVLGSDSAPARLRLVGPAVEPTTGGVDGTWAVSMHPLGMPLPEVPPGVEDAVVLARAGADEFLAPSQVGPALSHLDQQSAVDLVRTSLAEHGPATRLLIPGELDDPKLAALVLAIAPVLPGVSLVITDSLAGQQCDELAHQESATLW